jgi:hypothetical protein
MAVKAPDVRIIQPADGEHFNWGEVVNFSGQALDPQDGLIQSASLTWSNQRGGLGNGGQISASDLLVGPNRITLSVQNSAGKTASKQITIYVDDPLALPGPTLTMAPAALSFQTPLTDTGKQSKTINLSNMGDGALSWSAVSSADWLALDAANGNVPATVTVSADPKGLDGNRLYQATITFTGSATGYPNQVINMPVEMSIGNSFVNPSGKVPGASPGGSTRMFLPQLEAR